MDGSESGAPGKYRRIVQIGSGGMAQVFLALASGPEGVKKLVVLKQIQPALVHDPTVEAMFLDEARIAVRLNHPNVVQTYEVGREGEESFLCMEHLDGQPLQRIRQRITRDEGLTLPLQLLALVEALSGLHYVHQLCDYDGAPLAVIHRDVSPENIFVTYAGQVKLIDFGIAKALDSSHQTRGGILKGKLAYMAPEQALGEFIDQRADVFSAGVILWEMLAGRRMFKGCSRRAVFERLTRTDLPPPSSIDASVPARLEAICMRAIARRREDRYPTAADLQRDLNEAIAELEPRCSLRDLGALLEDRFREERARLQSLVQAELASPGRAPPRSAPSPRVHAPAALDDAEDLSAVEWRPRLPPAPRGAALRSTGGAGRRTWAALSIALACAAIAIAASFATRRAGAALPVEAVASPAPRQGGG